MHRFILFLFLFPSIYADSQRIFSASGALVSFMDMRVTFPSDKSLSFYPKGIIRNSVGLGFETKEWKRFSLTTTATYFTSGGTESSKSYNAVPLANFCLGVSGNYYIVDSKTQFYIGIGPRLDYIRSLKEVYSELVGDDSQGHFIRVLKPGITGSIGVNFQLKQIILGLKSNYYYRPELLDKAFNTYPSTTGYTNPYKHMTIRDFVFDLQFMIGYQFGKRKPETQPQ